MAVLFRIGQSVRTAFGRGVVREVRNSGRMLVEVRGRAMELGPADVEPDDAPRRPPGRRPAGSAGAPAPASPPGHSGRTAAELDLHGLTVHESLACAESALNDALLADLEEIRFVHGRSGGRIRAALHRWLRDMPAVKSFRIDPRNDGVTIVTL